MKKPNIKIIVIITIIAVILTIYLIVSLKPDEKNNNDIVYNNELQESVFDNKDDDINQEKIFVEIKGAVITPGVYEMDSTSRIIDVVNKAGGFSENANTRYINLSKKVKDEMNIIIYTNEEIELSRENKTIIIEKECVCPEITNDACIEKNEEKIAEQSNTNSSLISINNADLDELLKIPGIGEAKAKSIIMYREQTKFNSIEDIMNVKGIGQGLFDAIKEHITI